MSLRGCYQTECTWNMCKLEFPRGYSKFIPAKNTQKVKIASFYFFTKQLSKI